MSQSRKQEANLVSFKVLLTRDNKLVTEFSILPESEVNNLFKNESENQMIKSVLQLGKSKLSNLHNLFESELNVLND
jgi:hypothetical protein